MARNLETLVDIVLSFIGCFFFPLTLKCVVNILLYTFSYSLYQSIDTRFVIVNPLLVHSPSLSSFHSLLHSFPLSLACFFIMQSATMEVDRL